jgi:phospholipid N-methyltransferase
MQQRLTDYRIFFREFRRSFQTTGAILPSGKWLARALTHQLRVTTPPRRILEVGPGTGAVTAEILRQLQVGDQIVLVERNKEFVERLHDRLAKLGNVAHRIEIVHAGIQDFPEDVSHDVIISGLPLNNFEAADVDAILAKLEHLLAAGGTLSFFEYIAIRRLKTLVSAPQTRQRMREVGGAIERFLADREIRRDRVLFNIPPAWVHHVQRTVTSCSC